MQLIIVRGANGIVSWSKQPIDQRTWLWICGRDSFAVPGPLDPSQAEAAAVAIVQHSAPLVGAVSAIVQLDL